MPVAENGEIVFQYLQSLKKNDLPDAIILDQNMPKKNGYETAHFIRHNYPTIKILALSMYDNENYIIRMLKNGARGYILKDAEPAELKMALDSIIQKGYHYL